MSVMYGCGEDPGSVRGMGTVTATDGLDSTPGPIAFSQYPMNVYVVPGARDSELTVH